MKAPASRRLKKKFDKMLTWQVIEFFLKRIEKYNPQFTCRTTPVPLALASNYVFRKRHMSNCAIEEILRDEDWTCLQQMHEAADEVASASRFSLLPAMTSH
jgi:hypothetical protein